MIDLKGMSFGSELEVGDVDRRVPVPEHLGVWAFTETDVVNIHGEMRGIATDPLGLDPPWGGEVNQKPYVGWRRAAEAKAELLHWLGGVPGNQPSYTSLNASHIHVRVPGLSEDIQALKRLQQYIVDNQDWFVNEVYMKDYIRPELPYGYQKVAMIPRDGARRMPKWMNDNIQKMATTPAEFLTLQCRGKNGTTPYRPFRYSVHTYTLKRQDTVEFRWYRATLDPHLWSECYRFSNEFMYHALEGGPPVEQWAGTYDLPPFIPHDPEVMVGWQDTVWDKDRQKGVVKVGLVDAK